MKLPIGNRRKREEAAAAEREARIQTGIANGWIGRCPDCGGPMARGGDAHGNWWTTVEIGTPHSNRCAGGCHAPRSWSHTPASREPKP